MMEELQLFEQRQQALGEEMKEVDVISKILYWKICE